MFACKARNLLLDNLKMFKKPWLLLTIKACGIKPKIRSLHQNNGYQTFKLYRISAYLRILTSWYQLWGSFMDVDAKNATKQGRHVNFPQISVCTVYGFTTIINVFVSYMYIYHIETGSQNILKMKN